MTTASDNDGKKRTKPGRSTGTPRPDAQVPVVAIAFERDHLPALAQVVNLARAAKDFDVTHQDEAAGYAELCLDGMMFDCLGLVPGAALRMETTLQQIALPPGFVMADHGILTLGPGNHLAGAGHLLPVVRGLTRLVLALAPLPAARAVAWLPARLVMPCEWFAQAVGIWLNGGPFPALALSALVRSDDGLASRGLSYFTGQEFIFTGKDGIVREIDARGAVRFTDWLVANGRVDSPCTVDLPGFGTVTIQPGGENTLLVRSL